MQIRNPPIDPHYILNNSQCLLFADCSVYEKNLANIDFKFVLCPTEAFGDSCAPLYLFFLFSCFPFFLFPFMLFLGLPWSQRSETLTLKLSADGSTLLSPLSPLSLLPSSSSSQINPLLVWFFCLFELSGYIPCPFVRPALCSEIYPRDSQYLFEAFNTARKWTGKKVVKLVLNGWPKAWLKRQAFNIYLIENRGLGKELRFWVLQLWKYREIKAGDGYSAPHTRLIFYFCAALI